MQWTFEVVQGELSEGEERDSWTTEPLPSMWAVGPHPDHDSADWLVALRFVVRERKAVLAEVRFFPNEQTRQQLAPGEWSGNSESVPPRGLPATVVKSIALGTLEGQARAKLAEYPHPGSADHRALIDDDGEPPKGYWDWSSATETAQQPKRGRKPLSDELLAKVAYYYVEALQQGRKAHRHVESRMRTDPKKRPPAAQRIKKARARGFLTESPKPGQRGGDITPKAIATLKRSGFLDAQGERVTEQEGSDE